MPDDDLSMLSDLTDPGPESVSESGSESGSESVGVEPTPEAAAPSTEPPGAPEPAPAAPRARPAPAPAPIARSTAPVSDSIANKLQELEERLAAEAPPRVELEAPAAPEVAAPAKKAAKKAAKAPAKKTPAAPKVVSKATSKATSKAAPKAAAKAVTAPAEAAAEPAQPEPAEPEAAEALAPGAFVPEATAPEAPAPELTDAAEAETQTETEVTAPTRKAAAKTQVIGSAPPAPPAVEEAPVFGDPDKAAIPAKRTAKRVETPAATRAGARPAAAAARETASAPAVGPTERRRPSPRPPTITPAALEDLPVPVAPPAPVSTLAEPVTAEPVAAEPVVAEPVTAEPVAAEPVVVPEQRSVRGLVLVMVLLLAIAAGLGAAAVIEARPSTWEASTVVQLNAGSASSQNVQDALAAGVKRYEGQVSQTSFLQLAVAASGVDTKDVREKISGDAAGPGQVRLRARAATADQADALADASGTALVQTVTSDQITAAASPADRLTSDVVGRTANATEVKPEDSQALVAGLLAGGLVIVLALIISVVRRGKKV